MNTSYVPKNSTLPVLDYIPYHWKEIRSKYLLEERDDRSSDGNEDLLSVSQYTGVTKKRKQISGSNDSRASSLEGYKQVDQDNLVINIMLAWNGSLGVSKYQGIVSPAYGVYKINNVVYPTYLHYLVKSEEYKTLFRMYSTGVIDSRLRLYSDQLFSLRFIVPSYTEQEQIAHYLDYKNHLINKYIRIKKKQIELLKELKQAIINDAVKGKIDVRTGKPYPKYKDSGVDWLGMIPEGWSVKKLRNVATIKPSGVDKKTNASERPVRLCNYTDVYKNEYIVPDMEFMEATVSESEYNEYRLYKGDIIITKDSEMWNDIAVPSLICQDIRDLVCAYHLCLIRITNDCVTPEFILRLLQAKTYQYQFHIAANGITRFGVSKNTIKDALIAVPPKVTQNHLCDYLLSLCEKIETQIKTINSQIPYIKELQTRLVSDVVTGKLDVREIEVPDFVEELDVFEEDTFDDSMEEVVDAD